MRATLAPPPFLGYGSAENYFSEPLAHQRETGYGGFHATGANKEGLTRKHDKARDKVAEG